MGSSRPRLSEVVRECQLYNTMVYRDRDKKKSDPEVYAAHVVRRNTLGKRVIQRIKSWGYKVGWQAGQIKSLETPDGDLAFIHTTKVHHLDGRSYTMKCNSFSLLGHRQALQRKQWLAEGKARKAAEAAAKRAKK